MRKFLGIIIILLLVIACVGFNYSMYQVNHALSDLHKQLRAVKSERDSLVYNQLRSAINASSDTTNTKHSKKIAIIEADSTVSESLSVIIEELNQLPYTDIVPIDKLIVYLNAQSDFNRLVTKTVLENN